MKTVCNKNLKSFLVLIFEQRLGILFSVFFFLGSQTHKILAALGVSFKSSPKVPIFQLRTVKQRIIIIKKKLYYYLLLSSRWTPITCCTKIEAHFDNNQWGPTWNGNGTFCGGPPMPTDIADFLEFVLLYVCQQNECLDFFFVRPARNYYYYYFILAHPL